MNDSESYTNVDRATDRKLRSIEEIYIGTDRDNRLSQQVDWLLRKSDRAYEHLANGSMLPPECGGLMVIGDSGAGKTAAMRRAAEKHPLLAAQNARGELATVLAFSPGSLAGLGKSVAEAVGYPLESAKSADYAWAVARRHLGLGGIRTLLIDELQDIWNVSNRTERLKLQNVLRTLMINAANPISLVLSGRPSILEIADTDPQLRRRFHIIRFESLTTADTDLADYVIRKFSTDAGLTLRDEDSADLYRRLLHAAEYQFGWMTEIVREATEIALLEESLGLNREHFQTAYAYRMDKPAEENPFIAKNYRLVDVSRVTEFKAL